MCIEPLLLNFIYILFPILCYLSYFTYQKTFEKKINNLFFDLAILTAFYALLKYGMFQNEIYNILLMNSLLILSFYRERHIISTIMIITLVLILNVNYNYSIYMLILNYLFFIFLYLYLLKSNKKNYINPIFNILSIILIIIFNIDKEPIYIYLYTVVIYFVACILINLLDKSEKVIDLNFTIKMLEKEKLLRNSLFKVTHEIKNPIAVCKGYLDMIDTNDLKQVNKYIQIIKGEINRTLNIMNDFLDLTKLKINNSILDIVMLVEDTCCCAEALAENNNIELECNIPEEEILIEGDYERLKQVLLNIIKNSIEALKDRNNPKIILSITRKNEYILIKIKDNGIGMDKDTLKKIGEAFFTTKKNGTGLGIKLSKEIIEAHNGEIEYVSKEGIGTTVDIKLKIK